MSEIIEISPSQIITNATQCFNGVVLNVLLSNLSADNTYQIRLVTFSSIGGTGLDQPAVVSPSNPLLITNTNGSINQSFTVRLQADRFFSIGVELQKNSEVISSANTNIILVDCGSVVPLLTPTPSNTPSSTATPTNTPSNTTTKTQTPSITASPTVTKTNTSTPSHTPTYSPTTSQRSILVFDTDDILQQGEYLLELDSDNWTVAELSAIFPKDSNNRWYLRKTGDDLIYVLEDDGFGNVVVVDYTLVPSPTPTNTSTPTNTPTNTTTNTTTPTPTPTNTTTPTNTSTYTPTGTNTPTNTQSPTQTSTHTSTQTTTPTNTSTTTPTNTNSPSGTVTNTPTQTATNTQTSTNTPTYTGTPTNTITNTGTPGNTPTNTPTASPVMLKYLINNSIYDLYNLSKDHPNTFEIIPSLYNAQIDCPGETTLSLQINNIVPNREYSYIFEIYDINLQNYISVDPDTINNFNSVDPSITIATTIDNTLSNGIFAIRFTITDTETAINQVNHYVFRCST